MAERLDVRLTAEEKKRLEELAKQKGVNMTELLRRWIVRGDVVHVLAEQLQDLHADFSKWHIKTNGNTSIRFLSDALRNSMAVENKQIQKILFKWMYFFQRALELIESNNEHLENQLRHLIERSDPMKKKELENLILRFVLLLTYFHNIFVESFLEILQKADERSKQIIGERFNDEFRTRFNELASKTEDYLKRAQRELGDGLEHAIPRAKEFRWKS